MPTRPREDMSLDDQAAALDDGAAFAELDDVVLTLVSGADARGWLNDLVTTDVASLDRFESRPSLLLTPTGRVRASFHVLGAGGGAFFLAQADDQPERIGAVLAPYVLSADVEIREVPVRIFAMPGRADAPDGIAGAHGPSVLGGGIDVLAGADGDCDGDGKSNALRAELSRHALEPVSAAAVELRRIRRGDPRFPVDLDADSLPAEAGLDAAPVTDRGKGCFLGQESVAKVANLGHPPRVVLRVRGERSIEPGEPVLRDGERVGIVTSAADDLALVRVTWDARADALLTGSGVSLRPR
jgi:tRNA-modifying protein YgfZ